MRPEPVDIILGAEKFTIRPLTIGQLLKVEIALKNPNQMQASVEVITIALQRDYKNASIEEISATPMEIAQAFKSILIVGGMLEAKSGEPEAQTGTPSSVS